MRPGHLEGPVDGIGTGDCPEVLTKLGPTQELRRGDREAALASGTHGSDKCLSNIYRRAVRIRIEFRTDIASYPVEKQILRWPREGQIPAGGWRLHLNYESIAEPFEVGARWRCHAFP
jgi:hypothetical protein